MKKKITLLAIIAVVMTTGIFAKPIDNNVDKQVLISFTAKFDGAKEVSWNRTDHYLKASFTLDERHMSAYFFETGELIGVSRNLLSQQLPLNLELKKLTSNSWITDLFEFTDGLETTYFVTVENTDQKIQFKSAGANNWSIYKKVKKS